MIDPRDIRWLAGWMEGEGSFGFGAWSPFITADSTDDDVIARAAGICKVRARDPRYLKGRRKDGDLFKPVYGFSFSGTKAAQWMMTLYPLMGRRRQEQIRGALVRWRVHNPGRRQRGLAA